MKRRNERQKGFTLIELLVVLIVIAVLAAVTVPALTGYLDDAREKKAVSEAQVCVTAATEWAAVQRTALISQAYKNNQTFADAYEAADNTANKWSTTYAALSTAAPTVTGTLALAEGDGQYFLRPEPATTGDTTDDTMKDTVKTAAGVDGTLQKLQLNADGKVLYLLYTSAEGIPVAYTAAGTAQTPDTTVPVAKLPEDTTPTPPTPNHSGDLVFCVKDEYTGDPVPGIKFHLVDNTTNTQVSTSQTTDTNGMVYFTIDMSDWGDIDCRSFTLYPETWPEGYQVVYPVKVQIRADTTSRPFKNFNVQQETNENRSKGKYKEGYPGKYKQTDTHDHLYTFFVRSVPTLELRVLDENNNPVKDVNFTLSNGTKSIDITSDLSPTLLDVMLYKEDHLRRGRDVMDMSPKINSAIWQVNFTDVPKGYLYFDKCNLEIKLENKPGHEDQLHTQFSKGQQFDGKPSRTDIECENLPDQNKCIVTIHVQGGKDVNFFVYDGLDNVHTTQLPNATMELYDSKNAKIATFTTDENGKPKSAESFTETLSEGEYTLKLASTAPTGYDPPKDIPFTIKSGADGLLTLTGDAAYVDNTTSTVTMLVTKPNTMRFKLQIVDYHDGLQSNDPQWAGVNVRLTGKALDASFNDQRTYAIKSQADNEHTFDITKANSDETVTVTIVEGTGKEYDSKKHKEAYADNFVRSKFEFKLIKNADGTFTLTPKDNSSARDGYINGDTVYVYAYPKVTFDYICYPTPASSLVFGQGTLTVVSNPNGNSVYTVFDSKDSTHSTIKPWQMAGNRNHPEGIPLGSYELKNAEYHKWTVFEPDYTAPWYFTVTQDERGFPVIKDKNETITKTITAKYTYLITGS